jgi:hypothetical protein
VTAEERDDAMARAAVGREALMNHVDIFAANLHYEMPLYGRLEGIEARGCADIVIEWLTRDGRVTGLTVIDLKTTTDVSPRAVQRTAIASRWHGQVVTYGRLLSQQPQYAHLNIGDVTHAVLVMASTGRPHARIEGFDAAARSQRQRRRDASVAHVARLHRVRHLAGLRRRSGCARVGRWRCAG